MEIWKVLPCHGNADEPISRCHGAYQSRNTVLNSQLPSRTYLEERDQSGTDRTFFLPSKTEI